MREQPNLDRHGRAVINLVDERRGDSLVCGLGKTLHSITSGEQPSTLDGS